MSAFLMGLKMSSKKGKDVEIVKATVSWEQKERY